MFPVVKQSSDLSRILALPRVDLDLLAAGARSENLSAMLRLPGSRARLNPIQVLALEALAECDGLYLGAPVGAGKTLVSWLAALILEARVPWLLIIPSLRGKTKREFSEIARDWRAPNPLPLLRGYSELSVRNGVDLLDREAPDLIICDESDAAANIDGPRAKRLQRYLAANPHCRFVAMTGTPGVSLMQFAHHIVWALRSRAPVPISPRERETWASALDPRPRGGVRAGLGALHVFGESLSAARLGFRDRLVSAPGVVIVDEDSCDRKLTIKHVLPAPDTKIEAAFERFRTRWELPDEQPVSDTFSRLRHGADLGTGVYFRWNPRPPARWLESRKAFAAFVREKIDRTSTTANPLDTEGAVAAHFPTAPEVAGWNAVKKTFIPNSEPVWISSSVIEYAARWALDHKAPVFVEHPVVGHAIAALARCPYFGEAGEDGASRFVEDWRGPCAVSIKANARGRNLQYNWHEMLTLGWPLGQLSEQLPGRLHRFGQERDVIMYVLIGSRDVAEAFDRAERDAVGIKQTQNLTRKILRAEIERATLKPPHAETWRWGN